MKNQLILLLAVHVLVPQLFAQKKPVDFVNVFIGTRKMGHTFPGATAPFGMVQLSPQTNIQPYLKNGQYNPAAYEYCAGYQDKDSTIFGFAHTSFSGTGHSDLGDILIMPTVGALTPEPGTADQNNGYHSRFSKKNESAQPGYYTVKLDKYNITAELTARERTGFHQYTFPASDQAHILLDLTYNIYNYDGKNVWTFIRVENDSTITGYRQTSGWARTRTLYFAIRFSKPFKSYGYHDSKEKVYQGFYRKFDLEHNFPEMAGREIRAWFDFNTGANEKIKIKCALSGVSAQGALQNIETEIPANEWNFEHVKSLVQDQWNNELSAIQIQSKKENDKTIFYTALYHTFLSPVIYEDVDGKYRGLDNEIHTSTGFVNHTIFSLWDTYRALHPLFNLVQPYRNNDMIQSMLVHQEQSVHHMLPVWSHYNNENWCMIGYHAVSVIADAVAKNNVRFDRNKALQACVSTANVSYFDGLGDYIKLHYVPEDKSGSSVSKTLEYAYDDWCIAQLAISLKDEKAKNEFLQRSKYYKNVYDNRSGFMRPRLSNGHFKKEFDPMDTHGQGFIEGNAWNYGLYVPHQIDTMIAMMGGKKRFSAKLDSLFTIPIEDKYIEKNEDITRDGIIGNYVHGNEPGHHIPYLYNWTNDAWKTQERVRMIMKTMYANARDGLCGNDDAGQMSAWYVFSALGFYPVCPGSDHYAIGSPNIEGARIVVGRKTLVNIAVKNQSEKNIYVQKVEVDGKKIDRNYLLHEELTGGYTITFYMGNKPKK